MARVRSKDTGPKMLVRRTVHRLGYRYRLYQKGVPGRSDLVFAPRHKVIFVRGCFWHQHPDSYCKLPRVPNSSPKLWISKLEGNRARDLRTREALADEEWQVLEISECQCPRGEQLKNMIRDFLDAVD